MTEKEFTQLDWDDLRHFLAAAQVGTFLGAAKILGIEHATVRRRIAALETRLGRKLIDRRGRRIVLTPDGDKVVELAAPIALQVASIEQLGRTSTRELQGEIRISAPPALSSALLAKPVVDLRHQHPGIQVTLVGEKRFASLNRREADVAIRLSRPEEGDYKITKVGAISFDFYASEGYLASTRPADWTFIGYDESMKAAPQHIRMMEFAAGRPIALRSSVLEFQAAAACAGGGVVMLPDFAVERMEGLHRIDSGAPLTREIWLVVHSEIKDVPAVRAVVETLKQAFRR
jgi:DNA-binding transcriptional LysR family regulator